MSECDMDTDANAHEWCEKCKKVYPKRCNEHSDKVAKTLRLIQHNKDIGINTW